MKGVSGLEYLPGVRIEIVVDERADGLYFPRFADLFAWGQHPPVVQKLIGSTADYGALIAANLVAAYRPEGVP